MFALEKGGERGYFATHTLFGALLHACPQSSMSLCRQGLGADASGDGSEHEVLTKVI